MDEKRRLVVPARYQSIPMVTGFVGEAATAAGLDEKGRFHCQMAADEACTNVIEHAYGGEGHGQIEITCSIEPGVCQIEIVDHGVPFDPASIPAPTAPPSLDDLEPGGIGLHLMRQMMSEVRFEFTEHGNRLIMVKRQTPAMLPARDLGMHVSYPRDGVAVVSPEGRLDSSAAPALGETLRELQEHGISRLVIDMSHVTYISSRGLKVLVVAWRAARARGGDVLLCGLQPFVYDIIDTVGFTQIFATFPSCDQALVATAPGAA